MNLAILQARFSSSRLPGKVLADINGLPMIIRQINRVRKATLIDRIIVATSDQNSDDKLVGILKSFDIDFYRGDLNNVASRFLQLIEKYNPSNIIRLTGDCPLIDPEIIDLVVGSHKANNAEYSSNTLNPTYPDGLDVECFKPGPFLKLVADNPSPTELEHVTYGLYTRTNFCQLNSVVQETDYSNLRWTVDVEEDLNFVRKIYKNFKGMEDSFSQEDILSFLNSNLELNRTDASMKRNAGLFNTNVSQMDNE